MRVLMIALGIYSRTGGMEAFNRRVVRCLAEHEGGAIEGLHITCLWDKPGNAAAVPGQTGFFGGASSKLRTAGDFLARVRAMQPEVILYGHVMLTPLALAARALSPRSRQVLFVHGTEVWGDPTFRRVPALEIGAVRSCISQVVSVSEFTAGRMAKTFGLPAERLVVLPNATDLEDIATAVSFNEPKRPNRTLLSVTRLGPTDRYKGIDKVVSAMPEILKAVPQARYRVVGEGSLKAELASLAESVGVSDRVQFLGHLDDEQLDKCYATSDAFVLPSTGEGFGIVFLEAWKHRMPVICGNKDASAEVVTNGSDGLTVEPGDSRQIAEAAIRLLSDESLAHRLGDQGFQTLACRYTHEKFRARLTGILSEQAASNRAEPGGTTARCAF